MSDFSRFTTPKGQLLLNIKPPSVPKQQNNQPRVGTPTSNLPLSESKYVPYTAGSSSGHRGQIYSGQPVQNGQTMLNSPYQQTGVYQGANNGQIYVQRP